MGSFSDSLASMWVVIVVVHALLIRMGDVGAASCGGRMKVPSDVVIDVDVSARMLCPKGYRNDFGLRMENTDGRPREKEEP